MTRTTTSSAKARPKRQMLKTFRVSFSDSRCYFYIVKATDQEAAISEAERRIEEGDEGEDTNACSFADFDGIDEVESCTFKQRTRAGNWSTFERRFQPIERQPETIWYEQEHLPVGIDCHFVWTIVDCDGALYATPGFRFVNRFAYVVCAKPWTDDE